MMQRVCNGKNFVLKNRYTKFYKKCGLKLLVSKECEKGHKYQAFWCFCPYIASWLLVGSPYIVGY